MIEELVEVQYFITTAGFLGRSIVLILGNFSPSYDLNKVDSSEAYVVLLLLESDRRELPMLLLRLGVNVVPKDDFDNKVV